MDNAQLRKLARSIDHTLLKAEASEADIVELCRQGREWGFAAVCVNPVRVERAAGELAGSGVQVACVCGFPLGASTTAVKLEEARRALGDGATEIDVVIDIGWVLEDRWEWITRELESLAEAVHLEDGRLKVILECGLLDGARTTEAARRAVAAGADFLKTSTGFLAGGATEEDVALLRRIAGTSAGVKASGGIRTLERALAMLAAGADRLGTSSGVAIMEEARGRGHG